MKLTSHLDYKRSLANQTPVHLALQFEAPRLASPRPQPAAFCVVLDRSGSMNGLPLARAKEATQVAIKNLRPDDLFSVVIFDDEANTVIPLQPAGNKQSFNKAVEGIFSGGSTNLTGGWMLGRDELRKAPDNVRRRLLLLSDGLLNVGIVDPAQVKQVVGSGLEQDRVRTSCLGFGDHYNEDLMSEVSHATGGQFYNAVSAEKFPAIFESELEGLQKVAVQNLRVRLKRLDFCDGWISLGDYPSVALPDGRHEFAIGDLVSEEERIAVFALSVLPLPMVQGKPVVSLEGETLLEMEVLYDEFSADAITSKTVTQVVRIQQTQDPSEVTINAQAIPWVAMQRAGQVMKKVNEHMDAARAAEAAKALQEAIDALKRYGTAANVTEAVRMLEDMLRQLAIGEWGLRERKQSRYRHSSLRRMSSSEMWSDEGPAPSFKKPNPNPAPPPDASPPADPGSNA